MTPEQYKAKRLALGLTQGKLAKHLGIPRETISRRETGQANIDGEAVMAIDYLRIVLNRKPQKVEKEGK